MIHKILDYIEQNKMINKGDRIVVGVSGGADSICLLYVLKEICTKYEADLFVVHVNHGIRGEEAFRDEEFVEKICKEIGVECFKFHYDVIEIAQKENLTEEEAGRKVRYQAFLDICIKNKCNKIAIAHNKNDNAETVLFHMFRGSGIKGLSGIDAVRRMETQEESITVIRPLLCLDRMEIEEFLSLRNIIYQTDATNLTDDYSRNKIRNQVLTYVTKEINTNAIGHITGAAMQLREIDAFVSKCIIHAYERLVKQTDGMYRIMIEELEKEDIVIQKGIIRRILNHLAGQLKDIDAKHIDMILSLYSKQVGRYVHLPYDMIAIREYTEIRFMQNNMDKEEQLSNNTLPDQPILIPGNNKIPNSTRILVSEIKKYEKYEPIPKNSCTKWFDYDKIENAVVMRTRKEGDYIQINSSGGRKKLKDYFIDQKIPKEERSSRILIADGSHIMWILGDDRISEKYKVEKATNNILLMKLIDVEDCENDR